MLAKIWKKLGIFILIVACIFNIMFKLVKRISLNTQLKEHQLIILTCTKREQKILDNLTISYNIVEL